MTEDLIIIDGRCVGLHRAWAELSRLRAIHERLSHLAASDALVDKTFLKPDAEVNARNEALDSAAASIARLERALRVAGYEL